MVGTMMAIGIGLAAVSTAMSAKSAHDQGKAAKAAGAAQQGAAESDASRLEYNAQVADLQAEDAIARGAEDESKFRQSLRGLIGSQRAGFAGQGVDVGSGSAADVQADAARLGELDALTLRGNAHREAWGFKVQGEDLRQQAEVVRKGGAAAAAAGRTAASAAKWSAAGSIVGTGGSLVLQRYGWSGGGSSTGGPNVSALPPAYMRGV